MKDNPMVSIIVPVYNVDAYLAESIQSILSQTFEDFELLLIDDGSTDESGKICDEYAAKDDRVRVTHAVNGGVAKTRNIGLDNVKGKYILFVDSDDIIHSDHLKSLYEHLQNADADIAVCQIISQMNDLCCDTDKKPCILTGEEACKWLYDVDNSIGPHPVAKLCKAELFDNVRCPDGRIHEDQFIVPRVLLKADKVVVTYANTYFYRTNPTGIMHSKFNPKRYDVLYVMDENLKYFSENNVSQEIIDAQKCRRAIQHYLCISKSKKYGVEIPKEYECSESRTLIKMISLCEDRNFICYCVSTVHPKFAILLSYWFRILRIFERKNKTK